MRFLCLQCAEEIEDAGEVLHACPSCGDTGHVPACLDEETSITITPQELRILTFWATNWAHAHRQRDGGESLKTVRTITDRLGMQVSWPLTLSQEIADLNAHFGTVRVVDEQGRDAGS